MRYSGGKYRQRGVFVPAILNHTPHRGQYLEPFVGGGAMFERMAPHFESARASDIHEDLILMWQAAMSGWQPPEYVSREDWARLKASAPSPERAFAGFGVSFCGRFFSAYAPHKPDDRKYHHTRASRKSLLKTVQLLEGHDVAFDLASYSDLYPAPGTVVYCDPPYADTAGVHYAYYHTNAGGFDHERFWDTMDEWVSRGVHVYVSEYAAPDHWVSIVTAAVRATTGSNSRGGDNPNGYEQFVQLDRLWVPRQYESGYPASA